jgi:Protein of unknown function (DUF1207)
MRARGAAIDVFDGRCRILTAIDRHFRGNKGRALALLLVLTASSPATAQDSSTFAGQSLDTKPFRDQPYYEPLRAEPRAARISLLVPGWSKQFPHSEKEGSRFAWQIVLGRELPIVAIASQQADGRLDPGEWGVGLWVPVSFHMIEDFKDDSNPIVDTDYRFGFMAKAQYGLKEGMWLGFRFVPWAHESTHLGDEYTIIASRDPTFERVNVSFEYYEYGVSLETSNWTIRHGGINVWGEDGYYSDHLLGSDERTLTPSKKNFEPSFGVEYRAPEWRARSLYLSVDIRNKLRYAYHRQPGEDEHRQWSTTIQIGRAVPEGTRGFPLRDYFVQFYWGVNPYGQLRTQDDYWSAGFGWTFGG